MADTNFPMFTPTLIGELSIAMNVPLCVSVCLFARISQASHFRRVLPVAVIRSDFDCVTRYVLPVLWTTSYLSTIDQADVTRVKRLLKVTHQ